MLASIFEFVMSILGIAGTDPEAQSIVSQIFETILGFIGA